VYTNLLSTSKAYSFTYTARSRDKNSAHRCGSLKPRTPVAILTVHSHYYLILHKLIGTSNENTRCSL
jgi:hypothetical protein